MEDVHDELSIERAYTKKNYGINLVLVLHPLLLCSMNSIHWIIFCTICMHWFRDLFIY